jgi:hypothetical protein
MLGLFVVVVKVLERDYEYLQVFYIYKKSFFVEPQCFSKASIVPQYARK